MFDGAEGANEVLIQVVSRRERLIVSFAVRYVQDF